MRKSTSNYLKIATNIIQYNPEVYSYVNKRKVYNCFIRIIADIIATHDQPLDIKYEEYGDGLLFYYPNYSISFWIHDDKDEIVIRLYKSYTKNV